MSDGFYESDDWRDGYDAGIKAERAAFLGYMIAEGIISPDISSSAVYDSSQSDLVRRSVLGYISTISAKRGRTGK